MRSVVLCLLSRAALVIPLLLFAQTSAVSIQLGTDGAGHTAASATDPSERTTGAPEKISNSHPVRPENWPRLHIPDPVGRQAASKALDLAWERLAQPDCGAVLTFNDQAGRPLAHRLADLSVDLQTYLTMLVIIDGSREATVRDRDICLHRARQSSDPALC